MIAFIHRISTGYTAMIIVRLPFAICVMLLETFFTNCVLLNPAATTNIAIIIMPLAFPK